MGSRGVSVAHWAVGPAQGWWLHVTVNCGETEAAGKVLTQDSGNGAHRCWCVPKVPVLAQAPQWILSPGDVGASKEGRERAALATACVSSPPKQAAQIAARQQHNCATSATSSSPCPAGAPCCKDAALVALGTPGAELAWP